jgi:hypothetical protein
MRQRCLCLVCHACRAATWARAALACSAHARAQCARACRRGHIPPLLSLPPLTLGPAAPSPIFACVNPLEFRPPVKLPRRRPLSPRGVGGGRGRRRPRRAATPAAAQASGVGRGLLRRTSPHSGAAPRAAAGAGRGAWTGPARPLLWGARARASPGAAGPTARTAGQRPRAACTRSIPCCWFRRRARAARGPGGLPASLIGRLPAARAALRGAFVPKIPVIAP